MPGRPQHGDGGTDTGTATATVNVTSVNDAPVLANGAGTALAYTEDDAATLAFLDRRLAGVGRIGSVRRRAEAVVGRLRPA